MRILDTTTNWNRTFKNEDEIDDEQSARELFSFGHLPLGLGTVVIRVRSKILSLVRLVLAAVRGEGGGVEEGGLLLEWIRLRHGTRVIVLKLSFNGRQCQKLSSISPVLVSILLIVVFLSLELSDALLLFVMISQRFVLPSALGFKALNRLKIWPHNGPYLRLLKILYVTFSRVTRRSLVEFLVKFSVRFVV